MLTPYDYEVSLLHRWRNGDSSAGGQLYICYYRRVYRFFSHKMRDEDIASDLLHDTFIELQRIPATPRPPQVPDMEAPLLPFILKVAINVLRNHVRREFRRQRRELDPDAHALGEVQPGPSSVLRANRQAHVLSEGLRSIPLNDQIVLELRYVEGLSYPQIALLLDISETSLNGRLTRAKGRLGDWLKAHAFGVASEDLTLVLERWAADLRGRLIDERRNPTTER